MQLVRLATTLIVLGILVSCAVWYAGQVPGGNSGERGVAGTPGEERTHIGNLPIPEPIAPLVEKAIEWLVEAQHPDGGWGAGSHSNQQERDPHRVKTDPATTAFAAMALVRAGSTVSSGPNREAVRKATENLVSIVEDCADAGPRITDLQGTQPQSKLGPLVDTSMTAQYLARVLPTLKNEGDGELRGRVDHALDKCLRKLQSSQAKDGSWGRGGWAPVLQSSIGCSALEYARAAGKDIDGVVLARARDYQKSNFDASTGRAASADSAGVELYAFAGSQRAASTEARAAMRFIEMGKRAGKLAPDAPLSESNLRAVGVAPGRASELSAAANQVQKQAERLGDESLLRGFGNNGGEEYLSYLLTAESLVIAGGEDWNAWHAKMEKRLAKIQSDDGSWTGHHCITSPVFCTAAVVQCLTAGRDVALLSRISARDVASAGAK